MDEGDSSERFNIKFAYINDTTAQGDCCIALGGEWLRHVKGHLQEVMEQEDLDVSTPVNVAGMDRLPQVCCSLARCDVNMFLFGDLNLNEKLHQHWDRGHGW